jgi:transposase, IS5 family
MMPMSKQQSLALADGHGSSFACYAKRTRRDAFLKAMDTLVPWSLLCEEIEPHDPKAGNGRPPVGLEWMLRRYFIQHWFNLADEACEEALYDSANLRRFVGIDLGREPVSDATTLLRFRRLLEKHTLGEALFADESGVEGSGLSSADRDDYGCDDHRRNRMES